MSVPGVYAGLIDKVPMGAFMNKGLTMKTGETHMMRYMGPLLERVQKGEIDPSFVISHKLPIDNGGLIFALRTFYREVPLARSPFFFKNQPTEGTSPMSLINAGLNTLRNQTPEGYRSNHPWDYRLRSAAFFFAVGLWCGRSNKRSASAAFATSGFILAQSLLTDYRFGAKASLFLRDPWEDILRFRCEFLDDTADLRVQGNTRREDLRDEFSC